MSYPEPRKRLAFTLVELLVTVAIVAILAALLLVGAQKARESAQRASCVNNLRQLGVAFHSYHTVKGAFPTEGNSSSASASSYQSFYKSLLPYVEQKHAAETTAIPLFLCPARRDVSAGARRDYGYASSQGTGSVGPSILDADRGVTLAQIGEGHRADNTVMLAHVWMSPGTYHGGDATDVGWAKKYNSRSISNAIKEDRDPTGNNSYLGGPHGQVDLSLYADGHVSPYSNGDMLAQSWAYNIVGNSYAMNQSGSGSSGATGPGSTASNPLMPSGGSASTGYTFSPTAVSSVTTSGSSDSGSTGATSSGSGSTSSTPNWAQMQEDGTTVKELVDSPNATLGDYQRAIAIIMQYSQYMEPGAISVLSRYQDLIMNGNMTGWGYGPNGSYGTQHLNNVTAQLVRSTTFSGDSLQAIIDDVTSRMVDANHSGSNAQYYYAQDGMVFLDPEIAVGYDFTSSVNYQSVMIPKPLPGGQDTFELVVEGQTYTLKAGKVFDFRPMYPDGVKAFTIRGIHESERLDPTNLTAFVTGVTFMEKDAAPDLTMKPIVVKQGGSSPASGWILTGSLSGLLLVGALFGCHAWRRKANAAA
jgi:prepilin-type N-terminal cleavage/methylation domain-containing protein